MAKAPSANLAFLGVNLQQQRQSVVNRDLGLGQTVTDAGQMSQEPKTADSRKFLTLRQRARLFNEDKKKRQLAETEKKHGLSDCLEIVINDLEKMGIEEASVPQVIKKVKEHVMGLKDLITRKEAEFSSAEKKNISFRDSLIRQSQLMFKMQDIDVRKKLSEKSKQLEMAREEEIRLLRDLHTAMQRNDEPKKNKDNVEAEHKIKMLEEEIMQLKLDGKSKEDDYLNQLRKTQEKLRSKELFVASLEQKMKVCRHEIGRIDTCVKRQSNSIATFQRNADFKDPGRVFSPEWQDGKRRPFRRHHGFWCKTCGKPYYSEHPKLIHEAKCPGPNPKYRIPQNQKIQDVLNDVEETDSIKKVHEDEGW